MHVDAILVIARLRGPLGQEQTTNIYIYREREREKVTVDVLRRLALLVIILENATTLGERTRVLHRRFYSIVATCPLTLNEPVTFAH